MARCPGTLLATSATAITRLATAANVSGSAGFTWNSKPFSSRVSTRGGTDPSDHAGDGEQDAWPTIIRSTSDRCAPSAMRMPISCVRSVTL